MRDNFKEALNNTMTLLKKKGMRHVQGMCCQQVVERMATTLIRETKTGVFLCIKVASV